MNREGGENDDMYWYGCRNGTQMVGDNKCQINYEN